jgi:dihydrofolate reductase
MRKVIYAINLTLDGCLDHTLMVPDEALLYDYSTQLMGAVDTLLFGRKTYELMVPYWPDIAKDPSESQADRDFGQVFVSKNIVVFSRTLAGSEDSNTRIVRANLRDEILKLKQEPGKDILLGGVDLASQLMELGLVDEFRFVVHPVIAGQGRRLMEGANLQEKLKLKLVDSKVFQSGAVALRYVKQ